MLTLVHRFTICMLTVTLRSHEHVTKQQATYMHDTEQIRLDVVKQQIQTFGLNEYSDLMARVVRLFYSSPLKLVPISVVSTQPEETNYKR